MSGHPKKSSYPARIATAMDWYARRYPIFGRLAWRAMQLSWWTITLQLHRRLPQALAARRQKSLGTVPIEKAAHTGHNAIFVDPSDERGRQLIEKRGSLNPPTLRMWHKIIASNSWTHVIDIGANYGEMLVDLKLSSTVRVIAVEPNQTVADYLQRTLNEAGIRADIVRKAVAENIGTAELLIDRTWSGTSRFASLEHGVWPDKFEPISVPTITLEALLCIEDHPSPVKAAIKIDIEGYELPVLRSSIDILSRLDHFEILMELLFIGEDDLNWIFQNFDVKVFDLSADAFTNAEIAIVHQMITEPESHPNYYRNDMVLQRKKAV